MSKTVRRSGPGYIILSILQDRSIRLKQSITALSEMLLQDKIKGEDIVKVALLQKPADKATLIEVLEHASKIRAGVISKKAFQFAVATLEDEAPRVKWESARMISNVAHLFPKLHESAAPGLLNNTEHEGMVVRWSAATALAAIMKCNTALNEELAPAIQAIIEWEKDNAIRKIYLKALKNTLKG